MFQKRRLPRFDLLEVLLVGGVLFTAWWVVSTVRFQAVPAPEAVILRDTYGPDRFSEHAEEWIVRDFFKDRREGLLDVSANHYRNRSNTYFLERELGWRGIAVDPLTEFAADCEAHRPKTRFRAFFVSDASNERARLWVQSGNTLVSSADPQFTARFVATFEPTPGTCISVPGDSRSARPETDGWSPKGRPDQDTDDVRIVVRPDPPGPLA